MRQPGLYLSVPRPGGGDALVTRVEDEEDADFAGMESFIALGYKDTDIVVATLFRIAENGGLSLSHPWPISGPEVE